MNYSEILYDFAEGNFDEAVESELFFEMASNSELRTEFKNILSVNTALNSNRGMYAVPEESTKAIFSSVGLPAVASTLNPAFISSSAAGISKTKFVSSLIAATIVTVLLTLFISDNFANKNLEHNSTQAFLLNNQASNKLSDYFAENAQDASEPIAYKTLAKASYTKSPKSSKPLIASVDNNIIAEVSESDKVKIIDSENTLENLQILDSENTLENVQDVPDNQEPLLNDFNTIDNTILADNEIDVVIFPLESETFWNKLNLEVKNTQDWMLPSPTTTPSKFAAFHNLSLAVNYEFNDNLSSGFEVRRETFFQKFDFRDDENLLTIIEQQPNFTTFYLTSKYSFNMSELISPYIQLSAGANKVGFVGKFSGGVNYDLTNSFGVLIGVEYANMFYGYRGNTFNSSKIGFLWGLNYKF
ncbi:MAG: porin family protein [Candidatus Kapabacteria bacterium]|nr:porin family protein [Candidatus Kapabacteria bacterium]